MAVKMKIRSQRGATLMAALLFFLVAAVCGSIILAAATATLSRVKNQAKDAQAYYAVTSAAQLIRDDLMDSNWLITIEEEYKVESGIKTVTPKITDIQIVDNNLKPLSNDDLQKTISRDLKTTAELNASFVNTSLLQITAPSVTGFPIVFGEADSVPLTAQIGEQSSKLTIKLTNNTDNTNRFNGYKETDTNGNQLYWVKVSLSSVKIPAGFQVLTDGRDDEGKGTVTRTVCLGWEDPVIEKVER